jgi:hypothetical protein
MLRFLLARWYVYVERRYLVLDRIVAYSLSLYILLPIMLLFEPKHFTNFTI